MEIRKATLEDMPSILAIYETARQFMCQTGNPTQWAGGYPQEEMLLDDIEKNQLYVAEQDGCIESVFVYFIGIDPCYLLIEEGEWKNDLPYGVMHRVASAGRIKGAASFCIQWCYDDCRNLRMDTHHDNTVMQHVLEKNGFLRCGRVYMDDGTPRIAYHKIH